MKNILLLFKVHEIPQIKIFRFESPIIYFNAEYFRGSLLDAVGIDLKSGQRRAIQPKEFSENHFNLRHLTHVIIDCSSINQIDYSGGKIFLQALKELNDCQFKVYLCNLRCKISNNEREYLKKKIIFSRLQLRSVGKIRNGSSMFGNSYCDCS